MAYIDYYKTLGITKKASQSDIKKAYRKLARKYHPDINPGDDKAEKKFKEINEANEVLGNVENRKKYDKHGKDWQHAEEIEKQQKHHRERTAHRRQTHSEGFGGSDYSDFFNSMFGGGFEGGRTRQAQFRGPDYNAELQLDLMDVYKTHKRTLTVDGKNIRLTIPAGVKDDQIIKIKGRGGSGGNRGPNGDLLIRFKIANNSGFVRDGSHLRKSIEIDLYTALLGGEIIVPTLDGKVSLKVKPGTQSGAKVKLKGKGFPEYKKEGVFGDLFITYDVKLPTQLSAREKELFQELKKLQKS